MDDEFINPFIDSVVKVMKTMAFTESVPGKPFLKDKDNALKGDVTGIVGFTGSVRGSFSLSFSEAAILEVVSNMFGESIEEIDGEVQDAAGELSNMVSGDARRSLEQMGHSFQASVPTVISGKQHNITHPIQGDSVVMPFTTSNGQAFFAETSFESQ